mgnify:CR=1 FL=1
MYLKFSNVAHGAVLFLAAVTGIIAFVSVFGMGSTTFVELVGYFALSIESTLGVPQMLQNWKTKSSDGVSLVMIMSWFLGDVFKTVYFVMQAAPLQFVLCGLTQLAVDTVVLGQYMVYKK